MVPRTRYARSGEMHIAYQVFGDGPVDLVWVPTWIWQVEHIWEEPSVEKLFRQLAAFSRVIMFDRRGSGLSDPVLGAPTLEEQMDDVAAVMDAVGSERAAVFAMLEAGSMASLFAATHPERTSALVLYEATPADDGNGGLRVAADTRRTRGDGGGRAGGLGLRGTRARHRQRPSHRPPSRMGWAAGALGGQPSHRRSADPNAQ